MLRMEQLAKRFPVVASVFERYWKTTLAEYAAQLYRSEKTVLEEELKTALLEEWALYGFSRPEAAIRLSQLEQCPVLQTSHHVTPTNGPSFLAIDLISQAGLKNDAPYLVAANSGVAFSNTAWSGALSFGSIPLAELLVKNSPLFHKALKSATDRKTDGTVENRISLIPSRQRDRIVYSSLITSQQKALARQFSERLREILPEPQESSSYSIWACIACSRIQRAVFGKRNLFVFDINRVIRRYLIKLLQQQKPHPVLDLLFSDGCSDQLNRLFQQPALFLGSYRSKKSMKIEGLSWQASGTFGEKSGFQAHSRESLMMALQEDILCPGVFLQFLVLRFINGIKCLGSFLQTEYLEEYRNLWSEMSPPWSLYLDADDGASLTTGRLLDKGETVWPLDLVWRGETIEPEAYNHQPMSYFWEPIVAQLNR